MCSVSFKVNVEHEESLTWNARVESMPINLCRVFTASVEYGIAERMQRLLCRTHCWTSTVVLAVFASDVVQHWCRRYTANHNAACIVVKCRPASATASRRMTALPRTTGPTSRTIIAGGFPSGERLSDGSWQRQIWCDTGTLCCCSPLARSHCYRHRLLMDAS